MSAALTVHQIGVYNLCAFDSLGCVAVITREFEYADGSEILGP